MTDHPGGEAHAVRVIGYVSSDRTGRADDDWGSVESVIRLDGDRFDPDSLLGLDGFSHAEVIFLFDRLEEAGVTEGARHPRGNEAWPRVGIFAVSSSLAPR
jgi:tRNA (adenine37-N6)-methyltransferase